MATWTEAPRGTRAEAPAASNEVKLAYGVPEIVAFKFLTAKAFAGSFGDRALFTLADERRMWLDAEDGSDIERALRELGVTPGDAVKLTKIRHARGGGHSIRVERVNDQPPTALEAQLAASVDLARRHGAAAFSVRPAQPEPAVVAAPDAQAFAPLAVKLCSTMCALIDSMTEAKTYAQRRGIDLTNEDLRCLAATAFIQETRR